MTPAPQRKKHPQARSPRAAQGPRLELTLPWVVVAIAAVLIGLAWYFLDQERRIAVDWGYALDDSWIYAQMARNLATGQGFAFNFGRIIAAVGGLQTANLIKFFDNSFPKAASVMAAIYLVGMSIVWLGPETKGRPLPD